MARTASSSSVTNNSADQLIATFIDALMTALAELWIKGYTGMTYDNFERLTFLAMTRAMKGHGLTRKASAGLIGKSARAFFEGLKRNEDGGTLSKRVNLYWDLLLYVHQHKQGVTHREVLDRFSTDHLESLIVATLEALRHERRIYETGGKGDDASYFAPFADVPDHDPSTIEPSLRDHMNAVAMAFVASCEKAIFGKTDGVLMLTMNLDLQVGEDAAERIQRLVDEFVDGLRSVWQEATPAKPGEKLGSVTVYLGHVPSP